MYMCERGIHFASVSTIFPLDLETVLRVRVFFQIIRICLDILDFQCWHSILVSICMESSTIE